MFHPSAELSGPSSGLRPPRQHPPRHRSNWSFGRFLQAGALAVTISVGLISGPLSSVAQSATVSGDSGTPPIITVELTHNGEASTYYSPANEVLDHSSDQVDLSSVVVDDGGLVEIVPSSAQASIVNLSYPSGLMGVAVHENNSETPVGSPGFVEALTRVYNTADLRDYVTSDGLSQPSTEWGVDYHVMYDGAVTGEQYLVILERGGNTNITLTPLDDTGGALASGETVTIAAPYGWDSGIAPLTGTGVVQPMGISVVKISSFLGSAPSLWGFAVDNNDEADVKFLVGSPATAPAADDDSSDEETSLVDLKTLVYAGHDGGASCGDAQNYVEATQDAKVTYCYVVTNTGTNYLSGITLTTKDVSVSPTLLDADSAPLAPGDSATYIAETVPPADDADGEIDDTFVNAVTVNATQVDAEGGLIPDAVGVSAKASASAFPAGDDELTSSLTVALSVYQGHDAGASCPGTASTSGNTGDAVTYCYVVTNTGTSYLADVMIAQPELSMGVQGAMSLLAPSESASFYVEAHVPDVSASPYAYVATVSANPADSDGIDLMGEETATAKSTVNVGEEAPDTLAATEPADAGASDDEASDDEATNTSATDAPSTEPAAEASNELAYTGWETWVLSSLALALMIGGLWLNRLTETSHPMFAWAAARRELLDRRPAPTTATFMTEARAAIKASTPADAQDDEEAEGGER